MAISDKLEELLVIKQDIKEAIENKGVDMTDVPFTEYAEKVLEISGGMTYEDYARTLYLALGKLNQFATAWEHSLVVDPLEISEDSDYLTSRGTAQYPNGATEGIIIPHGLTNIGNYAFSRQAGNQPLVIPNSVTSIGKFAFSHWMANNQPLVIPNSVTSIGENAFDGWQSNTHPLVIPNSVTSIEDGAFANWDANNQPLVIPNSVTSIIGFSNWVSNNQPLVIPNNITSIGMGAFSGWEANNQPLVIANSVTSIGIIAFMRWEANTHPLVIPNSVTSIGMGAFMDWKLVPYVEIQAITPPTLDDANAFAGQNDAPIYVPDESVIAYKTAPNWSDLADRIFPISDK